MTPEICPSCGADVPRNARCCPECGADETTGWSDAAAAGDLGIPEEKFDYAGFSQEELGGQTKPRNIRWLWWFTALGLVILFLFFWFR